MTTATTPRTSLSVTVGFISVLATLAAGCDVPPDQAETESTSDAVINGMQTSARPEVGKIVINNSMCTATLISSRHFLTAAHCIDYASIVRGGTFTINPTSGTPLTFPIGRTLSIGSASSGFLNPGVSWQDVAVGELIFNVPAAVARPAVVATRGVRNGERVTIMGYGGDGRGGPSGIKRVTEYVVTGNNIVTQPGDSGGPVFLGATGANGEIALVTSAFYGGPIITDRDTFGDPVRLRSAVYAMVNALGTSGICYRVYSSGVGFADAKCNGEPAGYRNLDISGIQIWSNNPAQTLCYTGQIEYRNFPTARVCNGELMGERSIRGQRFTDISVWFQTNPAGQSVAYTGYDGYSQTREARDGQPWRTYAGFILDRLSVR